MLLSSLSCLRNSVKIITNKNNIRLISNVPFNQSFTLYNKDNFLIRKFNDVNAWYIKFTGLDEVKRLQDKVIITQERMEIVQKERREKGKIIVDVRKDATMIQEQLHQVKKWENVEKFVDLTQQEAELIKKERELTAEFEVLDKEERELFSTLCNTIRDSHEKEKAQSEYTKYWGIILSIIGTIVGAVVSTIISTIRNRQIVIGINKNIEDKFNEITTMYKTSNETNDYRNITQNILNNLSQNLEETKELRKDTSVYFNEIWKLLHDNVSNNMVNRSRTSVPNSENEKIKQLHQIMEINKPQLHQHMILSALMGFIGIAIVSAICCCSR